MNPQTRSSLFLLLGCISLGIATARIVNVESVFEPTLFKAYPTRGGGWPKETPPPSPTFGSNDRVRWATVRSLVEEGTFIIGERTNPTGTPNGKGGTDYGDTGIVFQDGYKSVDKVLHPQTYKFYATKPPLLTVVVAGEYWLLHKFLGWDLRQNQWPTVAVVLITFNLIPFAVILYLLARVLNEYQVDDWSALFIFASACFGTFLTTFAITLNNHVPAAGCIAVPMYLFLKQKFTPLNLIVSGLCCGCAVSLDPPAAAFAGALALLIFQNAPKGLLWYIPAVIIPIAAQTLIGYHAYGVWEPIYALFGGPWYEFPGSHWEKMSWEKKGLPKPEGIDFATETKGVYFFHYTFGHHGVFSLTPIWLIGVTGFFFTSKLFIGVTRFMLLMVVAVMFGFVVTQTNNYGGWTCGPRPFFWLTFILLLGMIPAVQIMAQTRGGRFLGILALGTSAFSTFYCTNNPWRHPWVLQLLESHGILKY